MKRITCARRVCALTTTSLVLVLLGAGTTSARVTGGSGPVTRTFSFVANSNSKTETLVNLDKLLINARCGSRGNPVIYAFSSSQNADLFGRVFDGYGRLHIVRDSSFTKAGRGVNLSTTSGDFDATGIVLFETYSGQVVSVNYAFDDSTTLGKRPVCTVYGSVIAS